MSSTRSAAVVVSLYFAYTVVAGVLRQLTWIPALLAQRQGGSDIALMWVGIFATPFPYVVAAFLVFWLWPVHASRRPVLALIGRAAVAVAGGAVISWIVGAVASIQVTGGWFTSMPREYSFPGWYLAQAPSQLVGAVAQNFPVLALAAIVGALLLRHAPFDREPRIE